MNKCQDILKIVRGNGFSLCLQVEARRTDGTAVEDFALQGDEVLKLLHNGTSETKSYETVGNNVFVSFDGDDDLGWYGLEMTGLFHDEPWRWCVPKVFQIVETNERANLPSWTFLADDTYIIGCGITLLSAVIHADWDETDTSAPSYIKNKPDLTEYALVTDLLATNQRVSTLENTTVKTVVQSLTTLQKTTARNNISAASVAKVNAKQDTISDLSTIRSGAADGAVARRYLNDFSVATHTSPEQVGQVLATVATKANAAQPRLTPGENITITEDNVISASGGGGSADAVLYTPQTLTDAQQTQARANISAYTKPSGGIPSTDLSSVVQTSLGKADSAQPRLTAGDNITITEDNVISATGGGGSADAVLYTPQTLTTAQQTQARENINTYSKDEVDNLVTTPNVNYVTVADFNSLPTTGESDTIYRVANWDGYEVVSDSWAEYAWNGSSYILLDIKSSTTPIPTYEVIGNLIDFDNLVIGKKITSIAKASDNTINPTVVDDENFAYVIATVDRTQHLDYGMCGYDLSGEASTFGFFGIVYNVNNGAYYTGNINASINPNAYLKQYETAKINAVSPTQNAFNIHQIAINIPIASNAMKEALQNKTLGLFAGSIVPKTTCSTMKESHNIFSSKIRVETSLSAYHLCSNYMEIEPSTTYVAVGSSFTLQVFDETLAIKSTIYFNQQADYSTIQNPYGEPFCTFTTGADTKYIRFTNQIGGSSGVTAEQWAQWQNVMIYKASLGFMPYADYLVPLDYTPVIPRMYDLAFIGDSITYGGWFEPMFTKITIKSCYSNGTNSIAWTSSAMESKFQDVIDKYQNGDVVDAFGNVINAPEMVFVFLGTNADANEGDMHTTMGKTISQLTPTADRTQAMRKFIYMLRSAFPSTKIIGLAPYNNFNQSTIAKMVEVANAIESNYQYLGVTCYNLSKISDIMPDFDTTSVHTYLSDGIHPNANGKILLSDIGVEIVMEKL